MTENVVFLVPGKPPMIGKAAFAAASRAQSAQGKSHFEGKSEIQEIRVLGDWAFMWTRLSVGFTPPGGKPNARSGHTLPVLLARDANLLAPSRPRTPPTTPGSGAA